MTPVQVKICGLTRLDDVFDAIELGADFLGFNFYPDSPRFIDYDRAQIFFEEIPKNIKKVGVFVNEELDKVVDLALELGLDWLQFHGDERPEALNALGRPWYKAFRLRDVNDLEAIPRYECEHILVDAYAEKAYGGTGLTVHWDLVRAAQRFNKKIILAGGLNPDNVALAVAALQPFMLDVASGVESAPGLKDRRKVELFIARAKSVPLRLASGETGAPVS